MRKLERHDVLHVLSDSIRPHELTTPIDPGFAALDNPMLQLHESSATVKTRAAMSGLVRDNLHACNGTPLLTEYTR